MNFNNSAILSHQYYRFIKNLKSAIIAFAIASIINVGFTITTNSLLVEQIANNAAYEAYFHTFCIINQMPVLLIGIVLYYTNKFLKERPKLKGKIILYGSTAIVLFLGAFVALHLNKRVITSSYVAALISGLIFLYLSNIHTLGRGYLLPIIGKHSFGMYCLHMLIIRTAKHIPFIADNSGNILLWSFLFVVVLVLSYYIGWGAESITSIKVNSNKK